MIPTPSGERRCAVGVDHNGEPVFEQFVRLAWHNEQLATIENETIERCAKVCEELDPHDHEDTGVILQKQSAR